MHFQLQSDLIFMFFLSGIREWTKRTVITRRKAYTWRKVTRFYIPITAHTDSVIHTLRFVTFLCKIIHEYTHTCIYTYRFNPHGHTIIQQTTETSTTTQKHPLSLTNPRNKTTPIDTTHTRVNHNSHTSSSQYTCTDSYYIVIYNP